MKFLIRKNILFFWTLITVFETRSEFLQCKTSYGTIGKCTTIPYCESIHQLASKAYLTEICGEANNNPLICCPNQIPVSPAPTPLPLKALIRNYVPPEQTCKTPLEESGNCDNIYNCPVLFNIISRKKFLGEDHIFLIKSKCGKTNSEEFCCPKQSITRENLLKPPALLPKTCQTPVGKQGDCKHIVDCPSLFSMLFKTEFTEAERIHLIKSKCEGTKNVCCPKEVPASSKTLVEILGLLPLEITDTKNEDPQSGISPPKNVEKWTNDPQCGRISPAERIFGGRSTKVDEYPWTTRLIYISVDGDIDYPCGGSLINKDFVLTAAHCINDPNTVPKTWQLHSVRFGEWNTKTDPDYDPDEKLSPPPHKDIGILEFNIHPQYNPYNYVNDIALLRLKEPVSFTNFIQPICLPSENSQARNYDNKVVEVAGWGATETGEHSDVKLKATLTVLNSTICKNKIKSHENIICAQDKNGSDTCQGDSGGPLMYQDKENKKIDLIGIVSFGLGGKCGSARTIGVYTSVAAHMDWIAESVMNSV